jgi:hypothetical protein
MIIDEWKHENYRPTAETNKQTEHNKNAGSQAKTSTPTPSTEAAGTKHHLSMQSPEFHTHS